MAEFAPAFDFTMAHEDASRSGRVTTDAGGRTRFGIAEKFHPEIPKAFFDEKAVPSGQAEETARLVLEHDYWERKELVRVASQDVANKLFDMAVNMGVRQAAIYAQRAANGLLMGSPAAPAVDGVIGDKTLAAINKCDPAALLETLRNLSKIHYYETAAKDPAQKENLKGWLRRAEA